MKLDVTSQLSVFPLLSEVAWGQRENPERGFPRGWEKNKFADVATNFHDARPVSLIRGGGKNGGQCLFG